LQQQKRKLPTREPSGEELAGALYSSDLIACCAVQGRAIVSANAAFARLFARQLLPGCSVLDVVVEEDRARVGETLDSVQVGGRVEPLTFRADVEGEEPTYVEMRAAKAQFDRGDATLLVFVDVSERITRERRLRALAHYDPLTDLPNRMLLQDRLRNALASAARGKHLLALLLVDLDGFKAVNDEYGHFAGDAVLRQVARRLASSIREIDTVARLGGDEFVIVLSEIRQRADAGVLAARVINSVSVPITVGEASLAVGASIGIAVYPDDGTDIDALVGRADAAMYAAKRGGRNRFVYADTSASELLSANLLTWSKEYELGVPMMDQEHADMFAHMETLTQTIRAHGKPAEIRDKLRRLMKHSALHFGTEERLMEKACYEGLPAHRAEHRHLLADLRGLVEHADKMAGTLITHYLRNWLIVHIETYDRAAAEAIRKAGND
jgi:diguanylate cyclase (GGDEF)-like protein/hemerythrin-like metal-binding protein